MRTNRFIDTFSIKAALFAALMLGGCIASSYPYFRTETAQRIAAPAWMIKRDVNASPFMLRAYERIHERGSTANIYIEGEGASEGSLESINGDPTPFNPVALHLASKDKAENVIYLARPCQYISIMPSGQKCDQKYWEDEKFSKTVIDAYDAALNDIAARYDITAFNLIGYSGGGTIAALLATFRQDVISVRTVSGILDHKTYSTLHEQPVLEHSLNPVNEASRLTKIPQYHFIGGQDDVVPPAVLHSYLQAMPPTRCVQTMLVQEATHDAGWVDKWPELLALPVTCYNGNAVEFNIDPMDAAPPFTTRELPIKP